MPSSIWNSDQKQQILFNMNMSHAMFVFSFAKSTTLYHFQGSFPNTLFQNRGRSDLPEFQDFCFLSMVLCISFYFFVKPTLRFYETESSWSRGIYFSKHWCFIHWRLSLKSNVLLSCIRASEKYFKMWVLMYTYQNSLLHFVSSGKSWQKFYKKKVNRSSMTG